jgi:hypothetical protein
MTAPKEVFVGIDVAKLRNAVAIADAGRNGEIRYHLSLRVLCPRLLSGMHISGAPSARTGSAAARPRRAASPFPSSMLSAAFMRVPSYDANEQSRGPCGVTRQQQASHLQRK